MVMSGLSLPGGANSANYYDVAFNWELQHTTGGDGRVDRINLWQPGYYRTQRDILWRVEAWRRG